MTQSARCAVEFPSLDLADAEALNLILTCRTQWAWAGGMSERRVGIPNERVAGEAARAGYVLEEYVHERFRAIEEMLIEYDIARIDASMEQSEQ